jgi:hypothetical protein
VVTVRTTCSNKETVLLTTHGVYVLLLLRSDSDATEDSSDLLRPDTLFLGAVASDSAFIFKDQAVKEESENVSFFRNA